jgi:hypothetical protein
LENNCIFFSKRSQNSCQAKKCQNIAIKAQLQSPNHLHQTALEQYLQQGILKGEVSLYC